MLLSQRVAFKEGNVKIPSTEPQHRKATFHAIVKKVIGIGRDKAPLTIDKRELMDTNVPYSAPNVF